MRYGVKPIKGGECNIAFIIKIIKIMEEEFGVIVS